MAYKCDQCDREFSTEQGLQQHRHDKHEPSRHAKKESKRQREDERKGEIGKKIASKKLKKRTAIAIAVVVIIGVIYFVVASLPSGPRVSVGPPGSTHTHQDFKLYVNGQTVDFSQPKYQLKSRHVHFEGGDGYVIHTHATGMTLGYMLNTLGIPLSQDCVRVDATSYCNSGNNTVKMYVNGQPTSDVNYLFQDLDKVLVSYGAESVEPQLASITNLAKTQSGRVMAP